MLGWIWGQTRCVLVRNRADTPVPPLDSQPDLWHVTAKYGDRHGVWAPRALTRTCPDTCRPEEAGLGLVALLQGETQQSGRL